MAYLQHEKETSVQALIDLIHADQLEAGARLPGEAVLCDRLGLSRHLIRIGLEQLQGDGVIRREGRSGSYVETLPAAPEAVATRRSAHSTISLMVTAQLDPEDIAELQDFALQRGFLLHLYFSLSHGHRADDERAYLEQVAANGYAGVVLHPTPRGPSNDPLFRRLAGRLRLAHTDWHSVDLPEQSFFVPDFTLAGTLASGHLQARGARRIVLVSGLPLAHHITQLVARGLEHACAAAGLPPPLTYHTVHTDAPHMDAFCRDWAEAPADTGFVLYGSDSPRHVAAHPRDDRLALRLLESARPDPITPWLPALAFDRDGRHRDALDYIMTGSQTPRHRLYPPVFLGGEGS